MTDNSDKVNSHATCPFCASPEQGKTGCLGFSCGTWTHPTEGLRQSDKCLITELERQLAEVTAERDRHLKSLNDEHNRYERLMAERDRLKDQIAEFIDGEGGEDIVHPSMGG